MLPRYAEIWFPGYMRSRLHKPSAQPERVWLTVADHFEPFWGKAADQTAGSRVEAWCHSWPEIARRHCDSVGRPPQYTFFYPEEHYRPHLLDHLARIVDARIADVEVHIHHDGEGRQDFIDRMSRFTHRLSSQHGLLRKESGRIVFGFIHGNWALDNSRPDGRWCGLNDELAILRDLGCYADFTMPCGPMPMQSRMVNTIYWATDDPARPKSYGVGTPLQVGDRNGGDLLMIPGPFGIRWRGRLMPRLETGELAAYDFPTPYRVERWLAFAPRLAGDVFIKLFTHGAKEANTECLLNGGLDALLQALDTVCTRRGCTVRYVTAWEMYRAILNAAGTVLAHGAA